MTELLEANWFFPTRVFFGAGRISELAKVCRDAGMKRPLFVTDRRTAELPIARNAIALGHAEGLQLTVFSDVNPDPTWAEIADGIEAFRSGGHDGVVAFGGGSGLDSGKTIAFMAAQERSIWDFEDFGDNWRRASPAPIAPIVAVPTTAGTGSELGRATVISDSSTGKKRIIFHPRMMPHSVICDPELTLGLPKEITVATGADAFAHCFESYCVPSYHPMADSIALEGMRLVKTYLLRAASNGMDLDARAQMMAAAGMGAVSFQKGLGAVHSLSHAIGSNFHLHHGLTNAIVLPYVMAANRPAIEDKVIRLATWLGLDGGFEGCLQWLLSWRAQLGIPHDLGAVGVTEDCAEAIAAAAVTDPTAVGNPIPLTPALAAGIFRDAVQGRV